MQQIYEINPKFSRAREHLKVFNAEVLKYLEGEPHEFPIEVHQKGNSEDFEVTMGFSVVKPMPPILSVLVGDILHNIRSGLDHLVFGLSHSYTVVSKGNSVDLDKAGTEFPIFRHGKDFFGDKHKPVRGNGLYKIRFVDPKAQTIIEALQPYNARYDNPRSEYLWVLQQLCNIDKHRRLNLLGAPLGRIELQFSPPAHRKTLEILARRPLEDGAVIGRGLFTAMSPGKVEVTMVRETVPEVVIEEPFEMRFHRYEYSGWLLQDILDFIELEVLPQLAPFL